VLYIRSPHRNFYPLQILFQTFQISRRIFLISSTYIMVRTLEEAIEFSNNIASGREIHEKPYFGRGPTSNFISTGLKCKSLAPPTFVDKLTEKFFASSTT